MPTIEIVSLGCNRLLPIKNSRFPFFVRQNTKLISHRGLFQKYLDKETGTILHLGDKEFGRTGFFYGSELIDWDFDIENKASIDKKNDEKNLRNNFPPFRFESAMFDSIKKILKLALKYSPVNKCLFYTDIQTDFYNNIQIEGHLNGKISFEDFINKQYNEYYIFNTLYEIN